MRKQKLLFTIVIIGVFSLIGSHQGTASLVDQVFARLQGLDIDGFLEQSFTELLLRDPEWVTQLGLGEQLGIGNNRLTNLSDTYIRETHTLQSVILTLLKAYDWNQFTPEQRRSAEVARWYLEDEVAAHPFMYHDFPINQFITSVHQDLFRLFTEIHPVNNKQEAKDYITRLLQVKTKFDQVIDGLRRRERAGIIPPKFLIQQTLDDVTRRAVESGQRSPFYTVFESKIHPLKDLSETEKILLLEEAVRAIEFFVLPGYRALTDYLHHLKSVAVDDIGVWQYPDGDAYYEYLLHHMTTTDMTVDEVHKLGLQEVARLRAEMHKLFDLLGYPQDKSLSELFEGVAKDSGTLTEEQIGAAYKMLIQHANQKIQPLFSRLPKADVLVKFVSDPVGGYYIPPALDGSRPGVFYAQASGMQPKFGMPTLVYHEAVPGHHVQTSLALELPLPRYRRYLFFTAYAEGWALYAERLMAEFGMYQDDPYGDLGRLQMEIFRAARLVVDTGIHAKRWTYKQAVDYLRENTMFWENPVFSRR